MEPRVSEEFTDRYGSRWGRDDDGRWYFWRAETRQWLRSEVAPPGVGGGVSAVGEAEVMRAPTVAPSLTEGAVMRAPTPVTSIGEGAVMRAPASPSRPTARARWAALAAGVVVTVAVVVVVLLVV